MHGYSLRFGIDMNRGGVLLLSSASETGGLAINAFHLMTSLKKGR
jgi:hypothetical protein